MVGWEADSHSGEERQLAYVHWGAVLWCWQVTLRIGTIRAVCSALWLWPHRRGLLTSQDGRVFIWTCDDASGNSWSPKLLHKFNDVVWHVSWSITANILAVSGGDNKVSAAAGAAALCAAAETDTGADTLLRQGRCRFSFLQWKMFYFHLSEGEEAPDLWGLLPVLYLVLAGGEECRAWLPFVWR